MDAVIEFIADLILELIVGGTMEILLNRKIPGWIRYPLGVLLGLVVLCGVIFLIIAGFLIFRESRIGGLFLIGLGILLLLCCIRKAIKIIRQM